MRLAIVIVFATIVLGFYPSVATAEPSGIALPDCLGRPIVKPTSVTLTCADGNFRIENVQWIGWGESFAAGKGNGILNDCAPSCAAGHFHRYPMLLIVTGRQTCPSGKSAYAKVIYAFIGRSPFPQDAPGTQDPTQPFPCKPMP
jgi:hypothetical protein